MTVTTSAAKRTTIYIGEALRAMLDDGRVEGDSVSERLDRLAARYATLVNELLPQRWSVSDWRTVVQVVAETRIARPTDAPVVGVRLKQLSKAPQAGTSDLAGVAYRFENLKLAEQVAVIDLAERVLHAGDDSLEAVGAFLDQEKVKTS